MFNGVFDSGDNRGFKIQSYSPRVAKPHEPILSRWCCPSTAPSELAVPSPGETEWKHYRIPEAVRIGHRRPQRLLPGDCALSKSFVLPQRWMESGSLPTMRQA